LFSAVLTFYIVAPFDPIPGEPGHPLRFAALKRSIEAMGHRCVWWTSSWDHVSKSPRVAPEGCADIQLLEVPGYQHNIGLARARNHRHLAGAYFRSAELAISQGVISPPDVQLITIPPLETPEAAFSLQAKFGGRVVIDLMDTWPDTFYQALPLPGRKLRARVGACLFYAYRRMLRDALNRCDAVTAQSNAFVDWAKGYGLRDKPAHVCYLGADLPKQLPAIRSFDGREGLRLVYMGSMGASYDLETVARAVCRLVRSGRSLKLDVAGAGAKECWMQDYFKKQRLESAVTFHGYLPKDQVLSLLDRSHLGLIPMFPESGVAMPYKACDYASRGLPLVHSLDGDLESLVKSHNAGLKYRAGHEDSLCEVLTSYLDAPGQVASQSQAAFRVAQENFDRAVTYPQMADFLARFGRIKGESLM
jgi:glycosyltransferase involved in cell wall biosynthesis